MKGILTFMLALLIGATSAFAHGDAVSLAQISDILKQYQGATKLEPAKVTVNKNNPFAVDAGATKWFHPIDKSGRSLGIVGIENVPTHHGHLAQATCFDKSGTSVVTVIVLRAMEDEAKEIKKHISKPGWWQTGAIPGSSHDAWSALLRSVARTKASIIK